MKTKLTRKELRKEERKAKSQRKALYYSQKIKNHVNIAPELISKSSTSVKKTIAQQPTATNASVPDESHHPASLSSKRKREPIHTSEKDILDRRINGVLNRLSLQTLSLHVRNVSELLQANSRSLVSEALCRGICSSISTQKNLLDGFIATLASFVALLSFTEMSFLGADVAEECIRILSSEDVLETDSRLQVISLICYLYCYGIVTSKVVIDLLAEWITSLSIDNVEFTLRALRITAVRLRKEDSQLFFNTISAILEHSAQAPKDQWTSRFRFLVESVQDLKNNKHCYKNSLEVEEIQQQFASLIKTMGIIKPLPLNVGLADFRSGHSVGRWWKVGAAWNNALVKDDKQTKVSGNDELATKLGLSSNLRKNVLSILLTCEDFNDAFMKLCGLKISDFQQREVASIIVRCCLREKSYNPFYGFLLAKLCEASRDYPTILKCIFWDFKLEESDSNVRLTLVSKLSRLYAFLLTRRKIKIDLLKKFAFESLHSKSISFLTFFLYKVLQIAQSDSDVSMIFSNISSAKSSSDEADSSSFRRGLRFFLMKLFPSQLQKLCADGDKHVIIRRGNVALMSLEP